MIKSSIKRIFVVFWEAAMLLFFSLPRFRTLNYLKKILLTVMGAKIGKRVNFYPGLWITPARNLYIGDDVNISYGVIITTAGGVEIGSRTMVGYRTQILSSNHTISKGHKGVFNTGKSYKKIIIEDDVWIGANCIITAGVTIGRGSVVAAGSVVTKDIPSNKLFGGVPARQIKNLR